VTCQERNKVLAVESTKRGQALADTVAKSKKLIKPKAAETLHITESNPDTSNKPQHVI
jgi:hypothetical protein